MELPVFSEFLEEDDQVLAVLWKREDKVVCEPIPSQLQATALGTIVLGVTQDKAPHAILVYGRVTDVDAPGLREPQVFFFDEDDVALFRKFSEQRTECTRCGGVTVPGSRYCMACIPRLGRGEACFYEGCDGVFMDPLSPFCVKHLQQMPVEMIEETRQALVRSQGHLPPDPLRDRR